MLTSVPITILSGFLGAGKTTLLNNLLTADHGLRIAVLVNDFGAINIDGQLIVGVEGETVTLSNGCICCTIRDDLLRAVLGLLDRDDRPEYIIIEASGVSDPMAVAMTFRMPELAPYVRLDSVIAVVDADQILDLSDQNLMLAYDQISVADIVILNKVDLVTPEYLQQVEEEILRIVPNTRIIRASFARVPPELLLGVGEFEVEKLYQRAQRDIHVHGVAEDHDHDHDHDDGHDHEHHDHSLVYSTWNFTAAKPFALERLKDALDALPLSVYRAKGVIWLNEYSHEMAVFHLVGKRASLYLAGPWGDQLPRSQLVLIGAHGTLNPNYLDLHFEAALVDTPSGARQSFEQMNWTRGDDPTGPE